MTRYIAGGRHRGACGVRSGLGRGRGRRLHRSQSTSRWQSVQVWRPRGPGAATDIPPLRSGTKEVGTEASTPRSRLTRLQLLPSSSSLIQVLALALGKCSPTPDLPKGKTATQRLRGRQAPPENLLRAPRWGCSDPLRGGSSAVSLQICGPLLLPPCLGAVLAQAARVAQDLASPASHSCTASGQGQPLGVAQRSVQEGAPPVSLRDCVCTFRHSRGSASSRPKVTWGTQKRMA